MFEKFRNNNNILKNYGLRPSRYLSAPGLSWDSVLKMTEIEVEFIPDPDKYCGFFYISNRYSKTNNPKQESKHIIYLDANNLYGYATSKFLSTSGFKWMDLKEFHLNKYTDNSSKACVLKVDLEYLKELRESHNNYPLAPARIEIEREMMSEYQLKIADLYNISIGNVKKLVPNFFDTEKYVLRHENL